MSQTDRQDRQRSDSTGQTVLQTVAQKRRKTIVFLNVNSITFPLAASTLPQHQFAHSSAANWSLVSAFCNYTSLLYHCTYQRQADSLHC